MSGVNSTTGGETFDELYAAISARWGDDMVTLNPGSSAVLSGSVNSRATRTTASVGLSSAGVSYTDRPKSSPTEQASPYSCQGHSFFEGGLPPSRSLWPPDASSGSTPPTSHITTSHSVASEPASPDSDPDSDLVDVDLTSESESIPNSPSSTGEVSSVPPNSYFSQIVTDGGKLRQMPFLAEKVDAQGRYI